VKTVPILIGLALGVTLFSCPLNGLCLAAPISTVPKGQIYTKGLGLNAFDLHLVNQGRFAELTDKLSTQIDSSQANRDAAWLAFAYLYLQKCEDLNKLANSYNSANAAGAGTSTSKDINMILIKTFACLCDKKLDLAEKQLQSIPAEAMNDVFVNYAFATLSGKQGKPQVAIAYTKRAVELAPDFAWGYRTIAFLQERWLHQYKDAETNYSKALAIEPKLIEATAALINLHLANSEYDDAVAVAQSAITHNPRNSDNYRRLADIYIQQWRLKEATQQLRKAIAIDSQNSQIYRQLAFILNKEGDLKAAIDEQKKAITYSKDKSADLVTLASLELAAGQQNEAIDSLKEAIDLNPENMLAISELTRLSIQTGKFDQLVSELNKCAAKLPKNALIKLRLGDALAAALQTDKAIESYKDAANLNANDPDPHTKIAALLIAKKDYEAAAKEYTHSLNINSNSAPNLVALGCCEAELDDYLKAEAAFVTALALHQLTLPADSTVPPTRVEVIRGLAALLYKEGRYADAAAQFIAVSEMDKNSANANLNKFMGAQANALRDLSKESFNQLAEAYNSLPADEKNSQKINYIDTLLRGKHFDEALSLLVEIAQSDNPDHAPIPSASAPAINTHEPFYYICLSQAYLGKGNIDQAVTAAKQAIAICDKENSPHSDAYCQLAQVLFAKSDLSAAEENANKAIGINSKAFRAYVLLGNMAMKRKQPKLAVEAANKALEINPYYIDAYLLLGNAQLAQADLKAALSTYNKAADLYPGLLQTHESLLAVLNKIGTREEISKEQSIIASLKSKQ